MTVYPTEQPCPSYAPPQPYGYAPPRADYRPMYSYPQGTAPPMGYGCPPPQMGYGCPPPQMGYVYVPPPQPGYAYVPPPPPGYGYGPPPPGYGYAPPVQPPKKKNGLGLGAGLLGSALGALLLGDIGGFGF